MSYALVVELDPAFSSLFERLAEGEFLERVTARDGSAALEAVKSRGRPAVVITNLSLAKLDAYAMLTAMQRLPNCDRVPVVAISSSTSLRRAAMHLASDLGIREVVAPTAPVETLRRSVRRALGREETVHATTSQPDSAAAIPLTTRRAPRSPERHRDPSRLARMAALPIVDESAPPDEELQRLVREAAQSLGAPMALVSIVLENRQWFKAHFGLRGKLLADRGTPIEQSFCRHVVDQDTPLPLVIPDATHHPVFASNELVRDGSIGSYAGAPLLTATGDVLGTLCILDDRPRAISTEQIDELQILARRVAGEIELQTRAKRSAAEAASLQSKLATQQAANAAMHNVLGYLEAVLSNLDEGVVLFDERQRVIYASRPLAAMVGIAQHEIIGLDRAGWIDRIASLSDEPDATRHALAASSGPFVAREAIRLARPAARTLRWTSRPIELPSGRAQLSVFSDVTPEEVETIDLDDGSLEFHG